MTIKKFRIDSRMLHGQVCAAYGRILQIDEYLVVNEDAANDELQKSLLEMAAMSAYTHVLSPKDAVSFIQQNKFEGDKTLVVFKELEDVVETVKLGLKIPEVQVGTMFQKDGRNRKKFDSALFCDEQDKKNFRYLLDRGTQLTYQLVPDSKEKKLSDLIDF